MPKVDGLTAKQQAFCESYVQCNDAKASAIAAGYSVKTASHSIAQILSNIGVKNEIARLRDEKRAFIDITREEIAESCREIRDLALERERYADANKANEILAKMGGLLKERLDIYGYKGKRPEETAKAIAASKAFAARFTDHGR